MARRRMCRCREATDLVGDFTAASSINNAGRSTFIEIANPEGLASDEHPFAWDLLETLYDAGVQIRAAVL